MGPIVGRPPPDPPATSGRLPLCSDAGSAEEQKLCSWMESPLWFIFAFVPLAFEAGGPGTGCEVTSAVGRDAGGFGGRGGGWPLVAAWVDPPGAEPSEAGQPERKADAA